MEETEKGFEITDIEDNTLDPMVLNGQEWLSMSDRERAMFRKVNTLLLQVVKNKAYLEEILKRLSAK